VLLPRRIYLTTISQRGQCYFKRETRLDSAVTSSLLRSTGLNADGEVSSSLSRTERSQLGITTCDTWSNIPAALSKNLTEKLSFSSLTLRWASVIARSLSYKPKELTEDAAKFDNADA
jgi:hypothetical protein